MKKSAKKSDLGRVTWQAPMQSATLIIGAKKGKIRANRTGFCAAVPEERTPEAIERVVRSLRLLQLQDQNPSKSHREIEKMYSASSVRQRGWYEGQGEKSVLLTFLHEGSKATLPGFRASMRHLADRAASVLCQDSVVVTFDTPGKRGAEGHAVVGEGATAQDRAVRATAQQAFTKGLVR